MLDVRVEALPAAVDRNVSRIFRNAQQFRQQGNYTVIAIVNLQVTVLGRVYHSSTANHGHAPAQCARLRSGLRNKGLFAVESISDRIPGHSIPYYAFGNVERRPPHAELDNIRQS